MPRTKTELSRRFNKAAILVRQWPTSFQHPRMELVSPSVYRIEWQVLAYNVSTPCQATLHTNAAEALLAEVEKSAKTGVLVAAPTL